MNGKSRRIVERKRTFGLRMAIKRIAIFLIFVILAIFTFKSFTIGKSANEHRAPLPELKIVGYGGNYEDPS